MKRHLLLGALLFGSILGANAQGNTCATATVPNQGLNVVDAINGTYQTGCWSQAASSPNGEWYVYYAENSGVVTIASNIAETPLNNDVNDTRVSVYEATGECTGLTCLTGNDDVSTSDYRSYVTFEAIADTYYYIVWDDRWLATGFTWSFDFTEATCFSATTFTYLSTPTYNEVSIGWTAPVNGEPVGYQYVYVLSGEDMSTGDVYDTDAEQADLSGLQSGTDYDFYIRTNCDNGDYSTWTGPITFTTAFEPADLAYGNSFEDNNLNGWESVTAAGNSWGQYGTITSPSTVTPTDGDLQMAVVGSTSAASDVYFVSRPINLPATSVTLSFDIASLALTSGASPAESNLIVLYGTELDPTTMEVAAEITGFTGTDYESFTYDFTPSAAGVYYFLFEYTTDAAQTSATQTALFLDNVWIDVTAGVKGNEVSKLTVYPNPATNVVNISNTGAALINGVNVTDINGRTVKALSFDGVANAQVNVSDLATGVYMMTINSDKGSVTKKVVKN
ncbi:T9SS type A sorting domain-containing protein [Flavobacterium sp. RHBU_3]|uniref:T9SS type A sorting domain-containing protein n=1 Tax=Flavobacterium sp. RHBU_3 TaxID=3391184 RepID=UPI0039848D4B